MERIVNRSFGFVFGLLLLGAGLAGCGTSAPEWSFIDAGGASRTLSDFRGRIVVLAFTNSWCEPCQEAAPHLQALQNQFANDGVKVVYVSSWERGDPNAFMKAHGYTYGLLVNGTEIARKHGVTRIPTFYVMGIDGRVIFHGEGFQSSTPRKMAAAIDKHIQKHGSGMVAQHGG